MKSRPWLDFRARKVLVYITAARTVVVWYEILRPPLYGRSRYVILKVEAVSPAPNDKPRSALHAGSMESPCTPADWNPASTAHRYHVGGSTSGTSSALPHPPVCTVMADQRTKALIECNDRRGGEREKHALQIRTVSGLPLA